MELMILFGAGFIGIIIFTVCLALILIKKIQEPALELKQRVAQLEEKLHEYNNRN